MTHNGSSPAPVATGGEARKSDRLDSKISSENTVSPAKTQAHSQAKPKKRRRRARTAKKRGSRCPWVRNDGGRRDAGYANAGNCGGCVPRAIAIATGVPYREVLDALTGLTFRYVKRFPRSWIARWIKRSRDGRGYDPARGCYDKIYGDYLETLGWQYTPVEGRLRLRTDEVPSGRLIIRVYRHLVAVIDGVIHDTHNSGRAGRRPVDGYWSQPASGAS
jgi:hypothetical protein